MTNEHEHVCSNDSDDLRESENLRFSSFHVGFLQLKRPWLRITSTSDLSATS